MKLRHNVSFFMSLLLLALSGWMFWQSWSFEYYSSLGPGPGLFPRWLSGSFLLLALLYMLGTLRRPILWSEVMPKGKDLRQVLAVPAAAAGFVVAVSWLGFVATGFLMTALLLALSYSWPRAAAIALSVNLLIYWVFSGWLDVPLPTGRLWEGIG